MDGRNANRNTYRCGNCIFWDKKFADRVVSTCLAGTQCTGSPNDSCDKIKVNVKFELDDILFR